jgi:hypothetical protein
MRDIWRVEGEGGASSLNFGVPHMTPFFLRGWPDYGTIYLNIRYIEPLEHSQTWPWVKMDIPTAFNK